MEPGVDTSSATSTRPGARRRSRHLPRRPSDESAAAPDQFGRRDRFTAYVAHELRTPIALQLALAESALSDPHADTAVFRAMGEDVVASCRQQQRLIEALLDLTCSHRELTCNGPVDIAPITRRALQAHATSELDSVVALEPAVATGDPTLLERLAANLLSNAVRHNIPRGRIEITTRTDAGRAVLAVANTGPVVPAGEIARLFQPFERLGSQPQAGADGIGLGLAIVQSIADAHNATVTAHAPATGGLAIEVCFPAVRPASKGRDQILGGG
jgi:signal transduction histidine kinase